MPDHEPHSAPAAQPPRTTAMSCTVAPDHPVLGALILVVAGIWIGVPLLAIADGRPALPSLGFAGNGGLLAVGIAQLLWALDLLLRRRTLTIGENGLQMAERGLLGVRRWREPLAHFRGLRHRRQRIRGRHGWRVVHRLELVHLEPARAVCLMSTLEEDHLTAAARQWAQWSGLPAWPASPEAPGADPATPARQGDDLSNRVAQVEPPAPARQGT